MNILTRFFSKRSSNPFNDERLWSDIVYHNSATGVSVTPDTARRCGAVLACVRVLAETMATLPYVLYRREGDRRVRETEHPLYSLLKDQPNRWQTSFEFREMMMGHVLLRGNAYAQKVLDRRGNIIELVPLNPTRMTPKLTVEGSVIYDYRAGDGQKVSFPSDLIFHLRGYASDGVTGISPIAEARETIGLALAAEEFGARTFANDAQPGGILEHPGKLGEEALINLRNSIQQNHGGVKNARKYMILEEGMKWTRIGMSPDDTQYIETRKFQIEEIARIFRVPPHLIGHLERATFSNIEHQGLEFVTHTVLPWLRRWEQAISIRLMTAEERKVYYSEFLVDGLLRGDIQTRYNAYAVGRQWGWLSADDVRRFENMDDLPNEQGDKYLIPLNMVDASTMVSATPVVDDEIEDAEENQTRELPKIEQKTPVFEGHRAFAPVFMATFERLNERVKRSNKPFSEHKKVIIDNLEPLFSGLFALNGDDSPEIRGSKALFAFVNSWTAEEKDAELLTIRALTTAQEIFLNGGENEPRV